MTISYQDQYTLATEVGFTSRVSAGMFVVALAQFAKEPLQDPAKQQQRMVLAHEIAIDVHTYNHLFSWLCVSQETINATADITDDFIHTTIDTFFDGVAQNVITL